MKVIRHSPEIRALREELEGKLLGESGDWVESINFAVRSEMDGALSFKMLERFGAIPLLVDSQLHTR
jgi:hypothetical protein